MKKLLFQSLACLAILAVVTTGVYAHCEIPCGIYDDEVRIKLISEHIATIEKSMNQIVALQKDEQPDWNQLIRWVTNKEHHATELQDIVAQYFMTQRIKPGMDDYEPLLAHLHEMLVYSMKCKQTTDTAHIEKLRSLVAGFEKLYFRKK